MKKLIVTVSMISALYSCGSKAEKTEVTTKQETPSESVKDAGMTYLDSLKKFDKIIERDGLAPEDIISFYKDNEVKADNFLKDKNVVVKGQVKKVGKDFSDKAYLTFDGGKYEISSLQCYFLDDSQLADLSSGQEIVLIGICKGKTMNVILKDCILVRK